MAEKEPDGKPANLEEQLRDMLRKANISFLMAQPEADEEKSAESEGPEEPERAEDALKRKISSELKKPAATIILPAIFS